VGVGPLRPHQRDDRAGHRRLRGYGHANKKAFDLVTPEKLKELNLSTPEALLNSGIFFLPLEPDIKTKYTQLLEEVKVGV
jgi:hypothetical protein